MSEAVYLRDPDGNGVELYRDRPRSEWPRAGGELRMTTKLLDLDGLLAELHESKTESHEPDDKTMKPTIEVNETNFENEVLQAATPVVVDFWAHWCGPCKMFAPTLDEVAREKQGRVVVAKVNIDEAPALAARFDIKSIPTLLYFNGGEVRDRTTGVVSKKTVTAKLDALSGELPKAA